MHSKFIQRNIPAILLLNIVFLLLVKKTSGEKSLFDEVPLNGALSPADYNSVESESFSDTKLETTTKGPKPSYRQHQRKKEKASLFDEIPNQGAFPEESSAKTRTPRDSIDFEVSHITPTNEFDMPYWDKRFLVPIVNSIAGRPTSPEEVVVPSSRFPTLNNNFNSQRGPPPFPQSPKIHYGPPPRRNQYPNHHPRQQQPYRHGWDHSASYPAKRDDEQQQHANKTLHVSANSGGPTVIVYTHPKKDGPTHPQREIPETTVAPPKNEIHYHYHIQNEESRPKPPPYGRPPFPPPRRRPPPPPPLKSYGVPPPSSSKGGGGYPPSVMVQSNTYHNTDSEKGSFRSSFNDDGHNNQQQEDTEDDFSRRTFVTKSRTPPSSYNPAIDSYSKPPSTSYEIPPSFNAPSSSSYATPPPSSSQYGPKGHHHHHEPETSYGPPPTSPAAPPAPPPPQSDAGGDQYETTITLQTIPITRQVTELVQVPNVVHKISSNRPVQTEQSSFADDFVQQPSSAYGAPAPPPSRITITTPPPSRIRDDNKERPFESHLSQILGVNSNPTPAPQRESSLLQELLLGQARNPGYDLTLNDLELLSLLQGSKGSGGGGSSVGILQPQNTRLNLFGGLLGGGRSQFPLSSFGQQNLGWGSAGSDGLTSLREAFREQRLQIALQDLRKQVREQGRDNQRERTGYRSLFTKGAMLLSALTLIPVSWYVCEYTKNVDLFNNPSYFYFNNIVNDESDDSSRRVIGFVRSNCISKFYAPRHSGRRRNGSKETKVTP